MSKTKVCILQNGLARGGTDTFVVNLCKSISKEEFEITVVNPSNKPESLVQEPEVLAAGALIKHTHPINGFKGAVKHLWRLYKILKRERFDVFQTNIDLFNGPNLFVAWLAGVPIRCCHSHNTQQQKEVIKGKTVLISLYQGIMRWMCWYFSNRRCGCSEEAMNFLYRNHDWHQNEYPSVIYNGIDLNRFKAKVDIKSLKESLVIQARYHILTVGQIIPQKNPLFLCDVFNCICKKRNDIDLIWVGVGKMEDEVKKRLNSYGILNKTHFLGRRMDVAEIMHCCDVFFLPSVFEGLGIVLIEAQASGLPCVASDIIPKLSDCGAVKYISLDETPEIWADSINSILNGKIVLRVDNNRLQNFSIEHMASQMTQVFK